MSKGKTPPRTPTNLLMIARRRIKTHHFSLSLKNDGTGTK
jgi:hypothetical protein